MKRSISIIGSVLLAAALISPAWAKPGKGGGGGGGGEPQAGGLPALEDRVEADEALIATLQGQNNFALVAESANEHTGDKHRGPSAGGRHGMPALPARGGRD